MSSTATSPFFTLPEKSAVTRNDIRSIISSVYCLLCASNAFLIALPILDKSNDVVLPSLLITLYIKTSVTDADPTNAAVAIGKFSHYSTHI